ncbi:MAG: mechanosensitive ion channel [Thermoproteota archaeon]
MNSEKQQEVNMLQKLRNSIIKLIIYIIILVIVLAAVKFVFSYISVYLPSANDYLVYANVLISLFLGILIALQFSEVIYWNLRIKLPHPEAASLWSVFKILGIVALVVAVVGSNISATAAAALGGLAGIVAGFAVQQTLGQAMAGLFISISRPFKVSDKITVAGQQGIVRDITTLYTILETDQNFILIPNNTVLGNIITKSKS